MSLTKDKPKNLKNSMIPAGIAPARESRPTVGITFLDRNQYGLEELCKAYRGSRECVQQLNHFLECVRQYATMTDLISNHASHIRFKNADALSRAKLDQIEVEYDVETTDMCHLHCLRGGKGLFVLHGFFLNNCFEIVWLDVKHEVHG